MSLLAYKIFFIFLVLVATTSTIFATSVMEDDNSDLVVPITTTEPSSFLRQTGRFLANKPRAWRTCDKYPRVCDNKGSPGPDCCKKQCVNVMSDKANCGKCGRKCKYGETCCKGQCVNTLKDKKNCGSCKNRCKKGSSCVYGMCSYA
ncbi:stigma-specific STIG1-like protein 1 [Heracleum sosnowskyi]|uniref:Stigma-specific STIG1-like protein 1 n=1 Tax=Heracleum sosnowskyi TaxID=360622 RepID=A0AAD8MCZ3_9APIA|nr:stigma-specific STIG1-like protein 1 [Heracleum sosnowskyi]